MKLIPRVPIQVKSLVRRVAFTTAALLSMPTVAFADLTSDVSSMTTLITTGVSWALRLFGAAAVGFIIKNAWVMHSADDDQHWIKGRKGLTRSIISFVVALIADAIITYVQSQFTGS